MKPSLKFKQPHLRLLSKNVVVKKAKKNIEAVKEDPYQQRSTSIKDDEEEDEEVSTEFLNQLIAATEAKERKERRQQLLKATEEEGATKNEESEEHLFRDFLKSKPSDRKALWAKVKEEQADLIAVA